MTNACPYCLNPNRDSVAFFENGKLRGCLWVEDRRVSIGADPPCVCDNYGTYKKYPNVIVPASSRRAT